MQYRRRKPPILLSLLSTLHRGEMQKKTAHRKIYSQESLVEVNQEKAEERWRAWGEWWRREMSREFEEGGKRGGGGGGELNFVGSGVGLGLWGSRIWRCERGLEYALSHIIGPTTALMVCLLVLLDDC